MRDRKLWALFTLALVLRFFNLSSESLWLDEGLSVRLASMSLQDINTIGLQTDHNPPLYLYLLHFWIKLFGSGEAAVRSLSVLLNLSCIPLLWLTAKRMFDQETAWYAILIFCLSPFQLYFAQETRAYSLLCFTSLAATLAFINLLRNPSGVKIFLATFSIQLLLYSHIYGWFTLLFLNLWFLLSRSKNHLKVVTWLIVQLIALLVYLPYAAVLFELVTAAQQGYWIKQPRLIHLATTLVFFSGSIWIFAASVWGLIPGAYVIWKDKARLSELRFRVLILLLWIAIPIIIPFLLSHILSPFYMSRYAIAASTGWYILIALGIRHVPKHGKMQLGAIGNITFCSLLIVFIHINVTTREPWREALSDLNQVSNGEPILVGSAFCIDEMFGYYWPDCSTAVGLEKKTFSEDIRGGLENIDEDESAWFVSSHFEGHEDNALKQLSNRFETQNFRDYFYRDLYNRKIRAIRIFKLQPRRLDESNRRTSQMGQ